MPHKRAKRSAREADRASKGTDNAPTNKNEGSAKYGGLSANVYRILNAERIRKEKKERLDLKRKRDENNDNDGENGPQAREKGPIASTSGTSGTAKTQLKIMPGEKLKNFNSRVEEAMRTDISSAIRHSKSTRKKNKLSRSAQAKADAEAEEAALRKPPPRRDGSGKLKERAVDFSDREKVKLNDVAMEPPSLKFAGLAKSATSAKQKAAAANQPVSMKQQKDLDEERMRVIKQYRDIKARQLAQREAAS